MTDTPITPNQVRQFLLVRYSEQIQGKGLEPMGLPDTFDLLLEGIVDSFGIFEMIGAIEKEFDVELDMARLDAEWMTILGPLVNFVVDQTKLRPIESKTSAAPT